jgi:hypothetical protein
LVALAVISVAPCQRADAPGGCGVSGPHTRSKPFNMAYERKVRGSEWPEKAAFWPPLATTPDSALLRLTPKGGPPMTRRTTKMTTTKKITVSAIKAALGAERRMVGKQTLTSFPPKTVPKGKVVVHIFPHAANKAWVQFPTDDIEPCDCGSPLFGPVHYREKEFAKGLLDDLLNAS